RRNEGVAMFGVAGMLPNGLAPPLSEFLIAHFGFRAFFASSAAFSLASLALSYFLSDVRGGSGTHAEQPQRSLRLALRPEVRAILAATLCFGFGLAALFTFLAPYAQAVGRGPVGPFFLGYALAAIM